jgi:hypothetical protein
MVSSATLQKIFRFQEKRQRPRMSASKRRIVAGLCFCASFTHLKPALLAPPSPITITAHLSSTKKNIYRECIFAFAPLAREQDYVSSAFFALLKIRFLLLASFSDTTKIRSLSTKRIGMNSCMSPSNAPVDPAMSAHFCSVENKTPQLYPLRSCCSTAHVCFFPKRLYMLSDVRAPE